MLGFAYKSASERAVNETVLTETACPQNVKHLNSLSFLAFKSILLYGKEIKIGIYVH